MKNNQGFSIIQTMMTMAVLIASTSLYVEAQGNFRMNIEKDYLKLQAGEYATQQALTLQRKGHHHLKSICDQLTGNQNPIQTQTCQALNSSDHELEVWKQVNKRVQVCTYVGKCHQELDGKLLDVSLHTYWKTDGLAERRIPISTDFRVSK